MQNPKISTWKTKDGREIPVNEMTDAHLANAIAAMERSVVEKRDKWIEYYQRKIYIATRDVALDAEMDYPQAHWDSGLAAAMSHGYAWALEPWATYLEQVEAGDPNGINPIYQELVKERSRRQGG